MTIIFAMARFALAGIAVWLSLGGDALAQDVATPFGLTPLEWRFTEALALITLACLFVPLSRRLGLGTVIGYLLSGITAGVALTLSFTEDPQALLRFAEFGVVLFLFVIGLEFRPARLWAMRGTIFGRGLVQLAATSTALFLVVYAYGLDLTAAIIVGLGLGLSSTALVVKALDEAGDRATPFGQTTIGVLLFEDLSIVPLLLLVALLAPVAGAEATAASNITAVLTGIAAIVLLIGVARYALDPMFNVLARTRAPELMTAAALGVVIFASLIMALAGLSYAMGAFIAGVLLAESSYRHQVEADIEPFRGLFLGLFFVAVGMSLDLSAVARNWLLIVLAVPVLVTVKGVVVYLVNRLFGTEHDKAMRLGFALAQHGEFGFVLFAAAASAQVIDAELAAVMVSIVTISMALSSQNERLLAWLQPPARTATMDEDFADAGGTALIIGFGRFGQMVAQPLLVRNVPLTYLDSDADRVREAGRFGTRVYFGDGARRDVLAAAGAGSAELIAVCTNGQGATDAIADLVMREFPQARLIVRAYDRIHAIQLLDRGVDDVVRETAASGMEMGARALALLGHDAEARVQAVRTARERDRARLERQRQAVGGARDREAAIGRILPQPVRRADENGSTDRAPPD
ncbi:monovalent cation:proton antiporter-2 (CPA2) family protein [Oceaniradius stylonematis]|nr:monovalent cation:proton antiporter-2 (CPA2) family protein [Oceaniradius stylonematis]